ncbi:PepSY domain-containing protein [Paenibacillus kandeliae]|uniref:PepSY domain-containing protein n=1 Tax=Paenibacillus kandeliae TaxID=3231269 RepID=UPI0034587F6D
MKQTNRRWWLTGAAVLIMIACVGILTWNTLRQAQPQLTAAQISDRVQKEYPGQITQIIQENGIYQVQLKSQQGMYLLTMDGRSGEMQTIKQMEATSPLTAADSNSNGNASADTEPSGNSSSSASSNTNSNEPNGSTTNHTHSSDSQSTDSQSSPSAEAATESNAKPSEASHSSNSEQTNDTDSSGSSKPSSSKSPTAVSVTGAQAEQIARSQVKGEVDDVKYEHNSKNGQQYYLVEIDTPDDREAVVQINSITGAVMSVTWDDEEDEDDK